MTLSELPPGRTAVMVKTEKSLRGRMNALGIVPGERITVLRVSFRGESILAEVAGGVFAFRREAADIIEVAVEIS